MVDVEQEKVVVEVGPCRLEREQVPLTEVRVLEEREGGEAAHVGFRSAQPIELGCDQGVTESAHHHDLRRSEAGGESQRVTEQGSPADRHERLGEVRGEGTQSAAQPRGEQRDLHVRSRVHGRGSHQIA